MHTLNTSIYLMRVDEVYSFKLLLVTSILELFEFTSVVDL